MDPIRIMMLGPTQSGKTLYLSSMWQKLQWPLDPGFHLDAVTTGGQSDIEAKTRLDRIYSHLITKPDFPPGTSLSSKTTYRFACLVRSNQHCYKACDFEYMDYAGGLLSQDSVEDPDFDKAVQEADVLLGLLDGVRLLMAMSNDTEARDWVHRELAPVLICVASSLQKAGRRPITIHFAISKWDAVQQLAPDRSLEDFRNFLLGFPPLCSLLRLMGESATVRLIPFSSLGSDFAEVTTETVERPFGQTATLVHTRKRMNEDRLATPIPLNVEIPIACALPDVLTQRLAALAQEEGKLQSQLASAGHNRVAAVGEKLRGLRVPLLREFGGWLQRSQKERSERLVHSLSERHRNIRDSETALTYLVEFCTALRDSFEREEPCSVLKRGTL